jgi:DNA invertase Pin-like site-specific DNA recombinase
MKVGYAQSSDDEQNLDNQRVALGKAGCVRTFTDGGDDIYLAARDRPGYVAMMQALSRGDALVVWRLDRIGRSASELISLLTSIHDRGIEFQSLADGIDTTAVGGRSLFHVVDALAGVDQRNVGDRTRAGLHAARMQGTRLGRPPALTPEQVAQAKAAIAAKRETVTGMAALFGVSRSTVQRAIGSTR